MTDATDLWDAVLVDYAADGLVTLTNPGDPTADSVDNTVGQNAAQAVINLWPAYAQEDYDGTNALHVEVGEMAVIALLWRRGGSATNIEEVKWDQIFGPDGLLVKVQRTGARGRQGPSSNSGVTQKAEATSSGQRYRGWADRESLPVDYLPRRTVAED